jgi:anthranilate phosphoribosyltransferase
VSPADHPFARYVRILGKGKSGSRSLSQEEARSAFGMILQDQVEPLQLGAFLMLLRVKEETAEELAGFVYACRDAISAPTVKSTVELDWPSYAGKKNQQPWYLLSALLLATNGVRILMHGSDGHTAGRVYSQACLDQLGVKAAHSLEHAQQQVETAGFAYLPLQNFLLPLHKLIQLKHLLGLRSPVNTLVRLVNPTLAPYSVQSVFHPSYADLHANADQLLGQPHSLVFKGEGGEVEIKPHASTRCTLLQDGSLQQLDWPRRLDAKPTPQTELSVQALLALWRGERDDNYGALAVQETTASILLLLQRAADIEQAGQLAQRWWQHRDKSRLPLCP